MNTIDEGEMYKNALDELENTARRKGRVCDRELALREICGAVGVFQQTRRRQASRLPPAQRGAHYSKLLQNIIAARKGYEELLEKDELIDPLGWIFDEDELDWDAVEVEVREFVERFRAHEDLIRAACENAASVDGRSRREKIAGLRSLIHRLASIWETQTQQKAAISRGSETSKAPGKINGPFVRFVTHIIDGAPGDARSANIGEYISYVLKQRDPHQAERFWRPSLMNRIEYAQGGMQNRQ